MKMQIICIIITTRDPTFYKRYLYYHYHYLIHKHFLGREVGGAGEEQGIRNFIKQGKLNEH